MNDSDYSHDKASLMGSVARYCKLLHTIYESFPVNSQEREAIAIAAKALLFSLPRDDCHIFLCQILHFLRTGITLGG